MKGNMPYVLRLLRMEVPPGKEDPLSRADWGRERANIPRSTSNLHRTKNVCFSRKRTFKILENHENEGPLSAKSGHCNESVPARRSKTFAGPLVGLPDGRT